jgi:DNA-binding SARP family transcriptional activator
VSEPLSETGLRAPSDSGLLVPGRAECGPDGFDVRCFGHFEVSRCGVPVRDWRREKAKTLLKHLVARRAALQRDVLLDMLWPELEPESAMRNLRVTLHALRRAVDFAGGDPAAALIVTCGDAYELNPEVRIWVDTDMFRELLEAGLHFARQGRTEESLTALEGAEVLYRDDYLVDDLYADWTQLPREHFKDDYLLVLTRLGEAAFAANDIERCITYCHKILDGDPAREDAYQRLMTCHARVGRRARALRWYELCRISLRRDLNVEPGDVTRRLAESIAAGGTDPGR